MSTPFRKIALVGASGHLGPSVLSALESDTAFTTVTIITRHSSTAKFPPSSTIVRISDDYPRAELVEAFKGHDAVILSLNFMAEKHHDKMVDASVEAGVKRLIPSLFGGAHGDEVQDIFPFAKGKAEMMEYVEKRALEVEREGGEWGFTGVATGLFFELCVASNFYGIDPKAKTATIWDGGSTRFSASTYARIGQAILSILKDPVQTKNQIVHISSFEVSLNDLLNAYKTIAGDEGWKVEERKITPGVEEAKREMVTEDFMTRMKMIGRLALLSSVKPGLGGDFVESGVSWNEKFGLEREDYVEVMRRVLGR